MISDELIYHIRAALGHIPTAEQERAIQTTALFLSDSHEQCAMVLRGSAGTGKTTLAAAIVKAMLQMKQKLVLMAPTGRAAKVFSLYAGQPAYTIHRRIYRQRSAVDLPGFHLNDCANSFASLANNLFRDTLFIIDEASMIADGDSFGEHVFGTGSLLDDLIHYVYNSQNCRMLLIGDTAQLPPVGEEESPALATEVLKGYGLITYECSLSEVLRQSQASGILYNATMIRQLITHDEATQLPRLRIHGFADITVVPGNELIESLASSYSRVGIDDTIVITRSNKRANIYNQGIRNTVLDRDDELCRGDQLMVVKNNYSVLRVERLERRDFTQSADLTSLNAQRSSLNSQHSTLNSQHSSLNSQHSSLNYIANGDHCVVQRVRNVRELYGFRFADVTLSFPDYDNDELTVPCLLDTLTAEAPALTREQQELLYNKVLEDYADIPQKAERMKKLKSDVHYNALQIKFGYAITCHKAQGGQWAHVYIDQGYMTDDMLTPDYIHWLYTALTRATDHVFLVNWPKTQVEET